MKVGILIGILVFSALTLSARANWVIKTYRNGLPVGGLSDADTLIATTAPIASTNIDVADLLGYSTGEGTGHFSVNHPVPGIPQNQPTDNYAVQGTGLLAVSEAGNYTFGLNTDDGARLRIDGANVIVNDGVAPPHDSAYVTIGLTPGLHTIEWTWFNAGGGAEAEAFAAAGTNSGFNSNFKLLGDPTGLAVIQSVSPQIITQPTSRIAQIGATVKFSVVADGQLPLSYQWRFNGQDIAGGNNSVFVLDSVGGGDSGVYSVVVSNAVSSTNSMPASLIVYTNSGNTGWFIVTYRNGSPVTGLADADTLIDGGFIIASTDMVEADMVGFNSGEGTGHFGVNNPVPGITNTIATDNYAVQGTGFLIIPVDGQYTFGLNTDDGGRLRIDGADIITNDVRSPPHDSAYVTISLSAGPHPIEWTWYNTAGGVNGGGAEGEVFAAPGVHTGFDSSFQLVGDPLGLVVASPLYLPITVIQTDRTPTTAETTPTVLFPPPPPSPTQLVVFAGGTFTSNPPFPLDTNKMTIVLTHGWNSSPNDWATNMAALIVGELGASTPNIVAWDWTAAAASPLVDPGTPADRTGDQGRMLGQALQMKLGTNYSHPIHFIGHSFGTLVNASAVNYVHTDAWASEPVSSISSWSNLPIQMTLFDEAEVGIDAHLGGFIRDVFQVLVGSGDFLSPPRHNLHPLPKRFTWADSYVTAFGLAHPEAVNVILTNTFPANGLSFSDWKNAIFAFHSYPMPWYDETIQTDISAVGWLWSFEREGFGPPAPATNTVFMQSGGSPWNLGQTNWTAATNWLDGRILRYHSTLPGVLGVVGTTFQAFGQVSGQQLQVGPPSSAYDTIITLFTSLFGAPKAQILSPHDLAGSASAASITNVPAYAWTTVFVPTNAVSMSFDFKLLGDGASDSFVAALNGTNIFSLSANLIETNLLMNSGQLDVSAYAGQTTELFFGIVGGTSTNAQITVQDILFYTLQTNLVDSVGDGIPDAWRAQYFASVDPTGVTTNNLSCATCDPDGDGQGNLQEYLAGTDPTNSASSLRITAISPIGGDVQVSFTSVTGKYYTLVRCDYLGGAWTTLVDNIPGNDGIQQATDIGGAGRASAFYRVQLNQSPNPSLTDSDGDGIPDWWMQLYFGHATGQASDHSRATDDADGDGMSNLQEFLAGTNPTNSASVFRILSVGMQGDDLQLTWATAGGCTNAVQAASNLSGTFSNISPNIIITGSGDTTTNYLDPGAATNWPSLFYRIRLVP